MVDKKLKEQVLSYMQRSEYIPLNRQQLLKRISASQGDKPALEDALDALETEGRIYRTKNEKYGLPEKMGLVVGILSVHPKGFGFIEQDGEKADVFVSAESMNSAMHSDKVVGRKLEAKKGQRREEAEIIKVLQRGTKEIVGVYEAEKNKGFVIPENKRYAWDIYIGKGQSLNAEDGDVVVCKITRYPTTKRNAEGMVIKILGHKGERGVDLLSIMEQNNIPQEFPEKVLQQSLGIPDGLDPLWLKNRLDLRDELTFTIDGSDAKDFDDAISITKNSDGAFQLGVHIADVSHYVQENTPIDGEALKRGTSVYLVDTVAPMLPEKLSNGVCSLLPGEDRLTLSCIMDIDPQGNLKSHKIQESVIRSSYRLVYEDVSDYLEQETLPEQPSALEEKWILAKELANLLSEKRKDRGAIEFEFPESKIEMKDGKVTKVEAYDRRIANIIIEEFMLSANEAVAEEYNQRKIPFVYRVHEEPDEERIETFASFIATLGLHLKGDKSQILPKDLQKIIEEIKGKPKEAVVSMIMLRSLKQARYSPLCLGHFGLAAPYYCHFTSPIRRYPDLQIHRIIKESLHDKLTKQRLKQLAGIVEESSKQSSLRERIADEAERQVEDLRKAEYMKGFIGEEFQGQISGVANFGIFVTLPNTIEGVIKLHSMEDDYYVLDQENFRFIGERTHKIYALGDLVHVKVEGVDLDNRSVHFILLSPGAEERQEKTDEKIDKSISTMKTPAASR